MSQRHAPSSTNMKMKLLKRRDIESSKVIDINRRGRPVMLGEIDEKVAQFCAALRNQSGHVSRSLAITTANILIDRSNNPVIRAMSKPGVLCAHSSFRRLGWKKKGQKLLESLKFFFSLCIFSQVRNIPERIILISTTGLRWRDYTRKHVTYNKYQSH